MSFKEIYPSPETVISMEAKKLGVLVLKHLSEVENLLKEKDKDNSLRLNKHDFFNGNYGDFEEWVGNESKNKKETLRSLMVAWQWLEKKLFIAPEPIYCNGSTYGNEYFITRRGQLKFKDTQV